MTSSTREGLRGQVATRTAPPPAPNADTGQPQPPTLRQLIERMRPEMARALPKHLDADRMARIALTVLSQTPKLAECTQDSFLGALMTCAQTGLEPGPLGQAYLVPYGNKVTFIAGYRGLIDLAWRSGRLASIAAETVHENDDFTFEKGLRPDLKHTWKLGQDRGRAIGYYASAEMRDGGTVFVVMSRSEVEQIRKRSRSKDSGPWVTDYDAMAKKTCIRQLSKYLPMSIEMAQAIAQDGHVRTDPSADALDAPPTYSEPQTVDGEVVSTEAGPVDPDGVVLDGQAGPPEVEDPPERHWPEVRQPAGGAP